MPATTRNSLIIGLVLLILIAAFIRFGKGGKRRFDWSENYKESSKQPFGTFILHEMMKTYFPNQAFKDLKEPVNVALQLDSIQSPANYVFLGDGFYVDTADVDKLIAFVQDGNNAIIAANAVPNYFLERIYRDSCDDEGMNTHRFSVNYLTQAEMNFEHPQLIESQPITFDFVIAGDTRPYDWSYIDTIRGECTEGGKYIAPIGTIAGSDMNFAHVTYGKGNFYIHSNPIAFTNFHLLDSIKLRYASKVFSHLQNGAIYWDTKSRLSREAIRRMNGSNMRFDKDSPLKYVLAQPALRWAWFIFLGLIALYLLFVAKRRQRVIPVLEEKTNTSLDFVHTIGHLYFKQGDYIRVCEMIFKQFQTFVRERYHLASREMDADFIKALAQKSDIPEDRLQRIANYERLIERRSLTENDMVAFHQLVEGFYKTCK